MIKVHKIYRYFAFILLLGTFLLVTVWLVINVINKKIYICSYGQAPIGNGECRGTGLRVFED